MLKRACVILIKPVTIMLLVSLALLALNVTAIGRLRPFNSDDLYWQQAVRTWKPFNHQTLYFGTKDTFVEEAPFFAVTEHFFSPSRKLLIAEAIVLSLTSFTCFYLASVYFLRKLRLRLSYFSLLPFVWFASFGYPLVQNYLNTDWRTFEMGMSFLTFALVAAVCDSTFRPLKSLWTKLASLLAVIYLGILIYSDPYFIFFTVVPVVLFVGLLFVLKKIRRTQLITVFAGIILGFVFAKLTELLFTKAGAVLVFNTPAAFVSFDNILTNIVASLHGLLIVYGADFFGRPIAGLATVGAAVNAAVLGYILYRTYGLRYRLQKPDVDKLSLPALWMIFLGLMIPFVFLVYTFSTLVTVTNYRYFIILIYCSITFLAFALSARKNLAFRLIASGLLVVGILFNLSTTFLGNSLALQGDVTANPRNSLNFDIIHTVEAEGLTKGYGSYWQGNVNTYLSANKVAFLPTLCVPGGKTAPFKWLLESRQYERPAQRSFFILDPDLPQPPTCTPEQLQAQFGEPQKTLTVSNKTIYVYDYDILSKME